MAKLPTSVIATLIRTNVRIEYQADFVCAETVPHKPNKMTWRHQRNRT